MQKRNVLNSPRLLELKKRRKRVVRRKFLIAFLGFVVIFGLSAYLSRQNNLNISEIRISGNKVVDTEAIRTTIQENLAGKYLWLFPKTNVLYYPQNTIRDALKNKFNRIKDVKLSLQDNKILLVSLSERGAKYTWCGNTIDDVAQKCYFLDDEGYIFDEAPYFSGEVYFKFYGSTDGNQPLGSYFSKQYFKQLISFKDALVGLGLKPMALSVAPVGDVNIFLSNGGASLGNSPKIIFKIDADYQNVLENLQAALTTEPLQSKFKNKYSTLQYIDLRFGNKVYDKFQ